MAAAHCTEFIARLPQGFDTIVGERGMKLSGGQRQRLAIARAFICDAPIVLLDEATSALDTESEQLVQDALARLFKGRTVIAIAHRLSSLDTFDRIVVLERGRIVEDGAPAELLRRPSVFARSISVSAGGATRHEGSARLAPGVRRRSRSFCRRRSGAGAAAGVAPRAAETSSTAPAPRPPRHPPPERKPTSAGPKTPPPGRQISSRCRRTPRRLLGKKVMGPDGEEMGLVVDVLVDKEGRAQPRSSTLADFLASAAARSRSTGALECRRPSPSGISLNLGRADPGRAGIQARRGDGQMVGPARCTFSR